MNVMGLKCRALSPEQCPQVAKAAIIVESGEGRMLEVLPLCAEHAPEMVHETAVSMADNEFIVVTLPTMAVGFLQ